MDDLEDGGSRDQAAPSGPSDISSRPMIFCPMRVVYDTQALLLPGDDPRPTQFYYYNTTNNAPNGIMNNQCTYGNNYQNGLHQVTERNTSMPDAFPDVTENGQGATNMTQSTIVFNTNALNDVCESEYSTTNFQQNIQEGRMGQDMSMNMFNMLPPPKGPGQIYLLQRMPQNNVHQNASAQSMWDESVPHQRAPQRETSGQQMETQGTRLQQIFFPRNPLAQKITQPYLSSHAPIHMSCVHQNVSPQNALHQNILQPRMSLTTPGLNAPEPVFPSPTIVLPLDNICLFNQSKIIINPEKNYEKPCAKTHAIKLKNLPPWVSKQMGIDPNAVDAQRVPDTMDLYITVDKEEVIRIASNQRSKSDMGCQVYCENLKKTQTKPPRKRTINSKSHTASKQLHIEKTKVMSVGEPANDTSQYDLFKSYLDKPQRATSVTIRRKVQTGVASAECENGLGVPRNETFLSNEITSTTFLNEVTVRETEYPIDLTHETCKLKSVRFKKPNSIRVDNGEPETRIEIGETETLRYQTVDATSSLSVNVVKPYEVTGDRRENDEATEDGGEMRADESEKRSDDDVIQEKSRRSPRKSNSSSQTVAVPIPGWTKVAKRPMEKDLNDGNKKGRRGEGRRRRASMQSGSSKKMAGRDIEQRIVDHSKAKGEYPDFSANVPRDIRRIEDLPDTSSYREERYVLTHVIEGVIIQESNYPFPIVKPKEKTCTEKEMKREPTDAVEETDIKAEKGSLLLHDLTPETMESWKVHEMIAYFEAFGYHEAAKVFEDQEVDGKALSLASRHQLEAAGMERQLAKELYEFMSPVRPIFWEDDVGKPLL